eukprot:3314099-Amphidinium_carterae.1
MPLESCSDIGFEDSWMPGVLSMCGGDREPNRWRVLLPRLRAWQVHHHAKWQSSILIGVGLGSFSNCFWNNQIDSDRLSWPPNCFTSCCCPWVSSYPASIASTLPQQRRQQQQQQQEQDDFTTMTVAFIFASQQPSTTSWPLRR